MDDDLTQSEVEWLRCLAISQKLTPVLPEELQRKFETARLVEAAADRMILTQSGCALLRQR